MSLLEDVKQIAEKATGWRRPDDPTSLLRDRKPPTGSRTTASFPITRDGRS
jgi:hypothetical protein